MSNVALLVVHIRSTNRAFWRNPAAAFFTLALPVMFLVLFSVLFGTKATQVYGHSVSSATFTLAGIVTFSVIGACYTNLAIGVTFAREGGFLKRLRGTPAPLGLLERPHHPRRDGGGAPRHRLGRLQRPGLRRSYPNRLGARPHREPGGRRGLLFGPRAGYHRDHPECRRLTGGRQRRGLPAAVRVKRLHPHPSLRRRCARSPASSRWDAWRPPCNKRSSPGPTVPSCLFASSSSWGPGAWPGWSWRCGSSRGSRVSSRDDADGPCQPLP